VERGATLQVKENIEIYYKIFKQAELESPALFLQDEPKQQ
jgi:hypothetical protein